LGFYPVVPDASWVERLLHWGVRTVQLRFKPASGDDAAVREQVRAAVVAGRAVPGAQVFINDHWQHALALGAYGVHLGQEDWAALGDAERDALRRSGMRLGLSTHTPEELALARSARPSYLAIGPVFPTTLKVMPYEPVGLERLQDWARLAAPYPVVAIGGLSLERMAGVRACGVDGVAVVSAVTQAADPQLAVMQALQVLQKLPIAAVLQQPDCLSR
jgi:thiamine-phosphate pyrophosphorylase/hydroxymethylpyrimidine kinase/phosphomethylpyrimidine kinase/thiamine-phosphate diphosphorylase